MLDLGLHIVEVDLVGKRDLAVKSPQAALPKLKHRLGQVAGSFTPRSDSTLPVRDRSIEDESTPGTSATTIISSGVS